MDLSDYSAGTTKAQYLAAQMATNIDRTVADLEKSTTRALGGIATAMAAGFGINALKNAFEDLVNFRGELERMSLVTGISVENLSLMSQAAKLAGSDLGTVESAATKLVKALTAANGDTSATAQALEYLGIKARDSFGQLRDPGDIMRDVSQKLGVMGDGANKTGLAIALFGKNGAELLPTLKSMYENSDLIVKVTAEQAAQAKQYEQALVRLNAAMASTKNTILGEMVTPMATLYQVMTQLMTSTDGVSASVKAMAKAGELKTWADETGYALATVIDFARITKDAIAAIGSSFVVVSADIVRGAAYTAAAVLPFGGLIRSVADEWRNAQLEAANKRWGDLLEENTRKTRDLYTEQLKLNNLLAQASAGMFDDQATRAQRRAERNQAPFRPTGGDGGSKLDVYATESAALEKQIAQLTGIGVLEAYITKLDEDRYKTLTPEEREALIAQESFIVKLEQEKVARAELLKSDEAMTKAQEARKVVLDDYVTSLKAQSDQDKFELDLMGKTAIEQEKAIAFRKLDLELKQAVAKLPDGESVANGEILASLVEQTEQAKRKMAAYLDSKNVLLQEKAVWDEIGTQAGKFFGDLLTNGKNAFSNLRDELRNFASEIIAFFAKKYVLQMVAGMGGLGATGANAALASMGSGGVSGLAGGLISGAGVGLGGAFGTGVLTGAGDFVGTGLAGFAGNMALAAGATDAFAATIAAAVPVIGWIAAIGIALYAAFGSKGGGPKGGGSFMGSFDASGAFTGNASVPGTDNGRFFTPSGGDAQMAALGQSAAAGYFSTLRSLGGSSAGMRFGFGFDTDPNGTANNRVSSEVRDAAGNLLYGSRDRDIGRDSANIAPELQLEASRAMLAALQHSDLPAYLSRVFDGITVSSATQEQIDDAIKQATALKTIMDVVTRDPLADLASITEANSNKYQTALKNNAAAIKDAMSQFDHTTASTEHLRDSTIAYYNAQLQLISGIDDVRSSIKDLFGSTVRNLTMGGLDKQGQYDFLRNEASTLQAQALASNDPQTIQRLAQQINADLMAAFNLLSPDEQNAHRSEFISGATTTQSALDARLEALRQQAIKDTQDTLKAIKALIEANTEKETNNANTQQNAANTQLAAAQTPRTLILRTSGGDQQVVTLP